MDKRNCCVSLKKASLQLGSDDGMLLHITTLVANKYKEANLVMAEAHKTCQLSEMFLSIAMIGGTGVAEIINAKM